MLKSILSKCKRVGGCMEYPISKDSSAKYPAMYFNGRSASVHRVVFEIFHCRPIPSGTFVLHKCDNPKCVNPSHLFAGTQRDNVRDMFAKGRARNGYGPMQLKSPPPPTRPAGDGTNQLGALIN